MNMLKILFKNFIKKQEKEEKTNIQKINIQIHKKYISIIVKKYFILKEDLKMQL